MQPAWRIVLSAFIGKVAGSLFVALCTALGFGPDRWVRFVIAGMPLFITPAVARLVFLLLASLTLGSLLWPKIIAGQLITKIISFVVASLPFVVGAFYITAVPQADRLLSQTEFNRVVKVFSPLSHDFPNGIQVESVSASPDSGGYGKQFMVAFHMAGLRVNGVPSTADATDLFPSSAQVASSQMRGLFIGIAAGVNINIPARAITFQAALKQAGFLALFTGWSGVGRDEFVFVISYR